MKINRFNENNKNWTKEKLKKNIDDNNFLVQKITEYILFKDEQLIEDLGDFYITDYYFSSGSQDFIIDYENGDGYPDSYGVDNLDELIDFFNNSNMYKKSKKYNI